MLEWQICREKAKSDWTIKTDIGHWKTAFWTDESNRRHRTDKRMQEQCLIPSVKHGVPV